MTRSATYLLFVVMCLVWGLTWIAIKTGITAVPPLFFAGTRFVAAGVLLLAWERFAEGRRPASAPPRAGSLRTVRREDWRAMLVASLLVIAATYSLLFWGMQHVASGLSAVLNLALMPVGLFAIGLAYGEERFSLRRLVAIVIGIVGLAVLFRPESGGRDGGELLGMAAIIGGSLAYCWGSVLSRPLLRIYSPEFVSGSTCLVGGTVLIGLALAIEPIGRDTLAAFAAPAVLASWLFLVLFGSLAAFTIYMRLVRDWGATQAGLYAFVSPAIAVAVGVFISGERVRATELLGMLIMLAATWFALSRPTAEHAEKALLAVPVGKARRNF
jgi:drug/metabolite transporter (DMT)-like permease